MTTISLAEVFTVTLDEHKLAMTPTMGLMRRIGVVEDMAFSKDKDEDAPAVDGIVMGQLLFDAYREGTKRHQKWETVEPILEDFTFQELFSAIREGMMARLGEIMEAREQSP